MEPMYDDVEPLRNILHRALVRYLTVRPGGFELQPDERLRTSVEARILGFGGARTFYKDRKPVCRSLDGLRPVTGDTDRVCRECEARARCVSQVRVDLIVERIPFRMLLAHSSARAFLVYEAKIRQRGVAIENVLTKIVVVNRRTWGELRFSARD